MQIPMASKGLTAVTYSCSSEVGIGERPEPLLTSRVPAAIQTLAVSDRQTEDSDVIEHSPNLEFYILFF